MGYRKHFCILGASTIRDGERMCIPHRLQYGEQPPPMAKPATPKPPQGPPLIISPPDLEQKKPYRL